MQCSLLKSNAEFVYQEHSTAFLARVRKSDAVDYYESRLGIAQILTGLTILRPVIKHPMDLGTVLKKVKAQQYKDKKAFKADLDLIWDNCLLYNSLLVSDYPA